MNTNNKPVISIIVPCYNQAEYLDECLHSVLCQSFSNWECIIVNDGSPDNTEEVALEWTSKDNRFKYYRKNNGGLSSARNYGIEKSRGEYILPLDCDDKINRKYVEYAITVLNDSPEIGVVYCNARFFGAKKGRWILPAFNKKYLLCQNLLFCSAVFRRSDWETIGGYDENMKHGWEDWEFWINLLFSQNRKVHKLNYMGFYYRQKAKSMVTSINENRIKQYEMYDYVYQKHKEFYDTEFHHPTPVFRRIWRMENRQLVLSYYVKKIIALIWP